MKTQRTSKAIAFSLFIAVAALLTSCSTSNQLSSQNPRYHLTLVKADNHPLPADKKENEPADDIAPLPSHGSLVSYQSDDQLKDLQNLLKADVKTLTKQVKKSDPQMYHQLKSIKISKTALSPRHMSSVTHTNDMGRPGGYFALFIIFLLLAILFYILTLGAAIFFIFAVLSNIAAVIFFILWIIALAS
jgi:hypothetical protein